LTEISTSAILKEIPENRILIIFGAGARKGLTEKPVKNRRGPATVMGSKSKICHWNVIVLGRLGGAMSQSQENCLHNDHHSSVLTLALSGDWRGDFSQGKAEE
jgi:hypothetical protein